MALADLLAELEREGDAEAERVIAAARLEAERVRADARVRLERRGALLLEPERERAQAETRRMLAATRHEARRAVLLARRRFLDRVLGAARERLKCRVTDPRFLAAVPRLVEEALSYLHGTNVTLRCPPALETVVRGSVNGRAGVTVAVDPDVGTGVVARASDGSVSLDNTLEARLDRTAHDLALEVGRRAGIAV